MPRLIFEMTPHPTQPKHSNRFDFDQLDGASDPVNNKFAPSIYIPRPHFNAARRIRVIIETIE